MPGSVPSYVPTIGELESDLDEILSAADAVQSNLIGDLVGGATSITSDADTITSNMIGDIQNDVDESASIVAKLSQKILGDAYSTLAEVYSKFAEMGLPIPTEEDIGYANASGDYIGSMLGYDKKIPLDYSDDTVRGDPPVEPEPDQGTDNPWYNPPPPSGGGGGIPPPTGPSATCNVPINGYTARWDDGFERIEPNGALWREPWTTKNTGEPVGDYQALSAWSYDAGNSRVFITLITPLGWMLGYQNNGTGTLIAMDREFDGWIQYPCYVLSDYNINPNDPPPPPPPPEEPIGLCPVPLYKCKPEFGWNVPPFGSAGEPFCERFAIEGINWDASKLRLENLFGMATNVIPKDSPALSIISAITGGKGALLPELVNRGAKWLTKFVENISDVPGCSRAQLVPISLANAAIGFVSQWTGSILPQYRVPVQQLANLVCQYLIPSPPEADNAFLMDTINLETWKCYQKAAGNYVSEFESILDSKRTKVSPMELSQLFRRKQLDEPQYAKMMRANGVMRPEDVDNIYNMTQSWPGISDVTRFLVRDIADKDLVDKYGMDDDFDLKWKPPLTDYAEAIGVSKELGKNYWRAHWHIPSYTMLTDMMRRLRPGKVDESLQVTQDDVLDALKQDDWLPYWARRMIETSYRIVTKTDAVNAFMAHTIDENDLLNRLMDFGYKLEDARFYVKYYVRVRKIREAKASGMPTIKALTRQLAKCEITEMEYSNAVAKLSLSESHEKLSLEAGQNAISREKRRLSTIQVKRPFELGLIDYDEATRMLSETDLDPRCVRSLVDEWSLRQLKRPKHMAAGQLCKMRAWGIISPIEHVTALVRNNWSREDAMRISQECEAEVSDKQFRAAQRAAEKAQRIREKLAREEAKRRKMELCGPPDCPTSTPGGRLEPKSHLDPQ